MTNGNEPAFARDGRSYKTSDDQYPVKGLTKREYFAAMAMKSLIVVGHANGLNVTSGRNMSDGCGLACDWADALITALNAPQEAK